MVTSMSHVLPLTREEALCRLAEFLPFAGSAYTKERNHDLGSFRQNTVSGLSAAIRRRMITEREVVDAVIRHHGPLEVEKFLQEVCWRSYWKGWLEQRPEIWSRYKHALCQHHEELSHSSGLTERVARARSGETGLTCFDAWSKELRDTGTLHNHTRMWTASIWVHTLGLPWELGAECFLYHLLDADPASNTLSWRWVAGLHTRGKSYQARASNIRQCTNGRFSPGPEVEARFPASSFQEPPPLQPFRAPADDRLPATVLVLCPEDWALDLPSGLRDQVEQVYLLTMEEEEAEGLSSSLVRRAEDRCLEDAGKVWAQAGHVRVVTCREFQTLWAEELASVPVRMPWVPVGHWHDRLRLIWKDVEPLWYLREWDKSAWPHAKKGFFGFWKTFRASLHA